MKANDSLTQEFKTKLQGFIKGCNKLEAAGAWDKKEYGEMEAYYQNDLVVAILRIIAADGNISKKETECLNMAFGFDYTVDELREVYENCEESFGLPFEEQAKEGFKLLSSVSKESADAYKELLELTCDIIIQSDGIIAEKETVELEKIKAAIFDLK